MLVFKTFFLSKTSANLARTAPSSSRSSDSYFQLPPLVASIASPLAFLFYFLGLVWFCMFCLISVTTFEPKVRGTYFEDNALLPTLTTSFITESFIPRITDYGDDIVSERNNLTGDEECIKHNGYNDYETNITWNDRIHLLLENRTKEKLENTFDYNHELDSIHDYGSASELISSVDSLSLKLRENFPFAELNHRENAWAKFEDLSQTQNNLFRENSFGVSLEEWLCIQAKGSRPSRVDCLTTKIPKVQLQNDRKKLNSIHNRNKGRINTQEDKLPFSAVLRCGSRCDEKEALVLVAYRYDYSSSSSYTSSTSIHPSPRQNGLSKSITKAAFSASSLGIALTFFNYLATVSWLQKNVILIVIDGGSETGIDKKFRDWGVLPDLVKWNKAYNEWGLFPNLGLIRTAVILDIPSAQSNIQTITLDMTKEGKSMGGRIYENKECYFSDNENFDLQSKETTENGRFMEQSSKMINSYTFGSKSTWSYIELLLVGNEGKLPNLDFVNMYSWYLSSSPSSSFSSKIPYSEIHGDFQSSISCYEKRASGLAIEWCLDNNYGRCLDWFDVLRDRVEIYFDEILAFISNFFRTVYVNFIKNDPNVKIPLFLQEHTWGLPFTSTWVPYFHRFRNMISFLISVGTGASGGHAAFLNYRIEAFTIQAVANPKVNLVIVEENYVSGKKSALNDGETELQTRKQEKTKTSKYANMDSCEDDNKKDTRCKFHYSNGIGNYLYLSPYIAVEKEENISSDSIVEEFLVEKILPLTSNIEENGWTTIDILTSLERMIRSSNNLEARLHHGYYYYLIPSTSTFISNAEYLYISLFFLCIPFLHAVVLYMKYKDRLFNFHSNEKKDPHDKDKIFEMKTTKRKLNRNGDIIVKEIQKSKLKQAPKDGETQNSTSKENEYVRYSERQESSKENDSFSSNVVLVPSMFLVLFTFVLGFIFYFIFRSMDSPIFVKLGLYFCRLLEQCFKKNLRLPFNFHFAALGVLLLWNILLIVGSVVGLGLILIFINMNHGKDDKKESKIMQDCQSNEERKTKNEEIFVQGKKKKQTVRFGIQISLLFFNQTSVTFLLVVLTFLSYPLALGLSFTFATITLLLYKVPCYSKPSFDSGVPSTSTDGKQQYENDSLHLKSRIVAMGRLILLWSLIGPITFFVIIASSLESRVGSSNTNTGIGETTITLLSSFTEWVYFIKEAHLLYNNLIPVFFCIFLFPLYMLYSIIQLLGLFI